MAQPILDGPLPDDLLLSPKVTLVQLAYAIKRAKERAIGFGGSDAIFIPETGSAKLIRELDLKFAEDISDSVAETINNILRFMMSLEPPEQVEILAAQWSRFMVVHSNLLTNQITFADLDP